MDQGNDAATSVANRHTPVPVVAITGPSDDDLWGGTTPSSSDPARPASSGASSTHSRREALKHMLPTGKLKEKLDALAPQRSESPASLQDRLMNKLLAQIIPTESGDESANVKDRRSRKYVDRPAFSLPVMSYNFRRFNARIGVAFVFQNQMIRLFTWRNPTQTLSFLAVYSFVCLDPALLPVLPLGMCLFFIMVPAFLARHPPPPSNQPTDFYPIHGPPIAPARNIKPAPELSKDFFRNMRDLQNCMEDFSRVHDASIALLAPPTNFSNEALSSTIFLVLILTTCFLFIASHLLPWRAVFLVIGWAAVCAGHPSFVAFMEASHADEVLETHEVQARSWFLRFALADNILSSAPETREVEVFELQRRANLHDPEAEFEPFLFSPSPYAPLSPARVAGDRPRGTPFFEDVEPPKGWRWSDKKWTLDLLSREWVEERCVTGVEVEIESERWVTDIQYDDHRHSPIQQHHHSADEDESIIGKSKAKAKLKKKSGPPAKKAWEEGNGTGKKGEWRRRRWVRLVERKMVPNIDGDP